MNAANVGKRLIELRAISKTYKTGEVDVEAVSNVTLGICGGDFVAIMGASGSGKSTLMNILGCLDQPTSGDYVLDGVNVAGLDRKQLAIVRNRKLGFVFQNFNLLARTSALENVELPVLYNIPLIPQDVRRQRATVALKNVGLADRLGHFPSQLSGGQQQRVAIARALVNRPELVLADEPTGNLDSRTGIEIMDLLQTLNHAGNTIVMVTHEHDIAAFCKRIVVMRDGKVVSDERNELRRLASDEATDLDAIERKVKLA